MPDFGSAIWSDISGNYLYCLYLRPDEGLIVMNTLFNGGWGREERIVLPVRAPLHIEITVSTSTGFTISVEGQGSYTFAHRLPWSSFSGNVGVTSGWTVASSAQFSGKCEACLANKIGCGGASAGICNTGYESTNGGVTCSECAYGTYKASAGNVACVPCSVPSETNTYRLECNKCAAGSGYGCVSNNSGGFCGCRVCDAGTYKALAGNAACIDCDIDKLNCGDVFSGYCTGGYESNSGNVCTPCKPGTYRRYKDISRDPLTFMCSLCSPYAVGCGGTTAGLCDAGYDTYSNGAYCNPCRRGLYKSHVGNDECSPCDLNSYPNCGGSKSGFCDIGYGSNDNGASCVLCPTGSYKDIGGNSGCTYCPQSFYADQVGSIACTACPGGRLTPSVGATSLAQCVNPQVNFYTGFAVSALIFPVALEYVIHARYHRIAFLRRQRVTGGLVLEARQISTQLQYFGQIALAESLRDSSKRAIKTWIFIFACLVSVLVLAALIFVTAMGGVFFKSMIVWRGLNLNLNFDFIEKMAFAIAKLAAVFKIPGFEYLFYPFQAMYTFFSRFKIDLSAISVTCKGASAPMELLMNLLIVGVCIVIIESNFQIFRIVTFNALTDCFIQVLPQTLYKDWASCERGTKASASLRGRIQYWITVVLTVGIRVAGGFDFFVSFMQFLMSLTNIAKFAESSGMHADSPECNNVTGFINFDKYIALIASCQAWAIFLPVVYEVSKILVPGLPSWAEPIEDIDKKRDPKSSLMHVAKYSTYLAPDLWLSALASSWIRTLRYRSPLMTTRSAFEDDSASGEEPSYSVIRYVRYRVIYASGVFVRLHASYDRNSIIGSINFGGIAETCSDLPCVTISAPNGAQIQWMQLVSHQYGWVPLVTPEGVSVFELVSDAQESESLLTTPASVTTLHVADIEEASVEPTSPVAPSPPGSKRRSSALRYEGSLEHVMRIQSETEHGRHAYRVVSCGANGRGELDSGIYFALPGYSVKVWAAYNDMHIAADAFHLCVIDKVSGSIEIANAYDVSGTGEQTRGRRLRHLVHDLNATTGNKLVVVFTTGYPGSVGRLGGGLPEALFRCGASEKFTADTFENDSAYVLIGVPGASRGCGFEINRGGNKEAAIDVQFDVTDAGFVIEMPGMGTQSHNLCCLCNLCCSCCNGSYLNAVFLKRTSEENKIWKEAQSHNMPSYFTLCRLECQELRQWFVSNFGRRLDQLAFVLSLCGLGHLFSKVGRRTWYLVFWKIFSFFFVCIGCWNDELVQMYKIHEHIKGMSLVWDKPFKRKTKEAYAAHKLRVGERGVAAAMVNAGNGCAAVRSRYIRRIAMPSWLTPEGGWFQDSSQHEESEELAELQQEELKRALRHNYSQTLYAIVATRGVLLQAIPSLTLLSIFASTLSTTPVFVHSKRLAINLPELLVSEPFAVSRALEQELIDEQEWIRHVVLTEDQHCVPNPKNSRMFKGVRIKVDPEQRKRIAEANEASRKRMRDIMNMPDVTVDEWIIAIKGTIIYVTESRAINFCFNLYKFILTLGLLWSSAEKLMWWMISAVIVLLPYCFLSALSAVAAFGSNLGVTDNDLEHALSCVGLGRLFGCLLNYTGSSKRMHSAQSSAESRHEIEMQEVSVDFDQNHTDAANGSVDLTDSGRSPSLPAIADYRAIEPSGANDADDDPSLPAYESLSRDEEISIYNIFRNDDEHLRNWDFIGDQRCAVSAVSEITTGEREGVTNWSESGSDVQDSSGDFWSDHLSEVGELEPPPDYEMPPPEYDDEECVLGKKDEELQQVRPEMDRTSATEVLPRRKVVFPPLRRNKDRNLNK